MIANEMKASEVLKRYAKGERNFQHLNLRGQSFKGQNLSVADFSETDIRSAKFTGANLRGAKFCGAKCGLQRRWILFLMVILFLLFGLSGFIIGLSGGLIGSLLVGVDRFTSNSSIAFTIGSLTLAVLGIFFTAIIQQNLEVALGVGGSVLAGTVVIAVAIAYSGDGASMQTVNLILASSVSLAGAGCGVAIIILATALAITVTGESVLIFTSIISYISALRGIEAGLRSATFTGIVAGEVSKIIAGAEILAVVGLSAYLGWHFLYREEKDTFARWIAVIIPALKGTSFRGADLTEVNFTEARLKSTDLREATLTRVLWYRAQMLDRVRPGDTYLKDAQVRQWLIGKGKDNNFDRKDLRGINLRRAALTDASFISADLSEANLQDADLSRAKLVQTQLDGTDLTGATLTGATIEDWGITTHTKLDRVQCRYVFMRVPTREDPNRRRKPDNWSEVFEGDDFADFIKPIFDTLDLYHNQGVDPRAIAISFKKLAENNPQAGLRVVAMEARGEDKFLLRAKTTPDANHSQLSAQYFDTYNQFKGLPESKLNTLLIERDIRLEERNKVIRRLEGMVETALERPSFYAQTYHHEGDVMPEESRINISAGRDIDVSGVMNLGTISGNVTNAINELPVSSSPQQSGIKELLTQLQEAIEAEANLDDEDKAEALEQVQTLAEAGQNPKDGAMKKLAKKATTMLKGIVSGLPDAAKLVEACNKLIPLITKLFGL